MGYTHYYYTAKEYDSSLFAKVSFDFKKMIPVLSHMGVKLADGHGENTPIIRPDAIIFNGLSKCGHQKRNLGITWASKSAKGVAKNNIGQKLEEITKGQWFAGATLETRACGGDCSHETFSLEQKLPKEQVERGEEISQRLGKKDELIFNFTKTAFKPYDLAVNVCLIIAKHYLKDKIKISSDGEIENWEEGKQLVQHFLGYGKDFKLDEDDEN
jgi:hypothetical protein